MVLVVTLLLFKFVVALVAVMMLTTCCCLLTSSTTTTTAAAANAVVMSSSAAEQILISRIHARDDEKKPPGLTQVLEAAHAFIASSGNNAINNTLVESVCVRGFSDACLQLRETQQSRSNQNNHLPHLELAYALMDANVGDDEIDQGAARAAAYLRRAVPGDNVFESMATDLDHLHKCRMALSCVGRNDTNADAFPSICEKHPAPPPPPPPHIDDNIDHLQHLVITCQDLWRAWNSDPPPPPRSPPRTRDVPVAPPNASVAWMLSHLNDKRQPLVVKGGGAHMLRDNNDAVDWLTRTCGKRFVRTSRTGAMNTTRSWAGLLDDDINRSSSNKNDRRVRFAELLKQTVNGTLSKHTYLHDGGLLPMCPQALFDLKLPKFVTRADCLQHELMRSAEGGRRCGYVWRNDDGDDWTALRGCTLDSEEERDDDGDDDDFLGYHTLAQRLADSWPSIFVGAEGSRSAMHVEAGATSFWMSMLPVPESSGTKRWVLYDAHVRAALHEEVPLTPSASHGVFGAGRARNRTLFPAASRLSPYVIHLKPGDLLLVPWGMPHTVTNVGGPTLALAGNVMLSNKPVVPTGGDAASLAATIRRDDAKSFEELQLIERAYNYPTTLCDPRWGGSSNAAEAARLARRELLLLERLHNIADGFESELEAKRQPTKNSVRKKNGVRSSSSSSHAEEHHQPPLHSSFWLGAYKPLYAGSSSFVASRDLLGPELLRRTRDASSDPKSAFDALALISQVLEIFRAAGETPPSWVMQSAQRATSAARKHRGRGRGRGGGGGGGDDEL
ncbi:JmjC domain-containing protein [Pycnococcus provasolii]